MERTHITSISPSLRSYRENIRKRVEEAYEFARRAIKNIDPLADVHTALSYSVYDNVEYLTRIQGIADRLRQLASACRCKLDLALRIAGEIVRGDLVPEKDLEKRCELAIRAGLAVLTDGKTVAPTEGISAVHIKRRGRRRFLSIYFANPIRSAAGTEQALTLVIADYVRQVAQLDPFIPTEQQVKRIVEEVRTFEREVIRFASAVSDAALEIAYRNLPVELTGVPTDKVEVSAYRDVEGVETNRVRGGALRVLNDGIVAKAHKIIKEMQESGLSPWSWLEEVVKVRKRSTGGEAHSRVVDEITMGRPIISLSGIPEGFRIRLGRARNTGFAALGIHPATMVVLGGFLAIGSQLITEGPGKAGVVMPVSSIEGPVVKLRNGAVVKLRSRKEAQRLRDYIEKILWLGDVLVAVGEFIENNAELPSIGYCEEWWSLELRSRIEEIGGFERAAELTGIPVSKLRSFVDEPLKEIPSGEEALVISRVLDVPLHPRYTPFFERVSNDDLRLLHTAIQQSLRRKERLEIPFDERVKQVLEELCVEHRVEGGRIVIEGDMAMVLQQLLDPTQPFAVDPSQSPLENVAKHAGVKLRNKLGTVLSARLGRPEKAQQRKMKGRVNVLFPVGGYGQTKRSLARALEENVIQIQIFNLRCSTRNCPNRNQLIFEGSRCPYCGNPGVVQFTCPKCGAVVPPPICPDCDRRGARVRLRLVGRCPTCGKELLPGTFCPACGSLAEVLGECPRCGRRVEVKLLCRRHKRPIEAVPYSSVRISLREYVQRSVKIAGVDVGNVRGVEGLTSYARRPEPLVKGLLRAKHGLFVFKDGTVRFNATNAPLTHFYPREIGVSVEKLRELGYVYDVEGSPLVRSDQLVELMPQDIIIPEDAAEHMVKVCKFIDELLVKYYRSKPFYCVERKEDLIGKLVVGIAPHTSCAVVGRVVGFTKARCCFAHPLWHAAKRRNCDGDEDSLALLMDVFLNFSLDYLPAETGGRMDAPLITLVWVNAEEVDEEVYAMETCDQLPLELYEMAGKGVSARTIATLVDRVGTRLGTLAAYQGYRYTAHTVDIHEGDVRSAYSIVKTMREKLNLQLRVTRAINRLLYETTVRVVLNGHVFPDIAGNLMQFGRQQLRCTKCNRTYRRPPLSGLCENCRRELKLTVFQKTIEKYLPIALDLVSTIDEHSYEAARARLLYLSVKNAFGVDAQPRQREEQKRQRTLSLTEFL